MTDGNRLIHRVHLHAVFTRAHEASFGEQRVAITERLVHIAADSIDYRAGNFAGACVLSHDIAPNCAVGTAIVVDDHDIALGHIIHEITYCAWGDAGGDIPNRECRPDDNLLVVIQRHHPKAVARQAQLIQRIGNTRGIQPFEQGSQLFIFWMHR
ncbi:hypothetical protein D3C80_1407000 [compost metagenome]